LIELIEQAMKEELRDEYIPGVLNLVHGKGSIVGEAIVSHPRVDLISFTGSTEVGKHINEAAGASLKRVSLEMGGKNAQIVMNDANQELALDAVLWGAFGTTGQRCTATSRLILHKEIHDKFIEKLVERVKKLRLGYGNNKDVDVGPCISEEQRERVNEYVQIGIEQDKATKIVGGATAAEGELSKGWFYMPTIFIDVKRNMTIAREEIFGPVLAVLKADSLDESIEILNDTPYGLSSSIFTQDVNAAFRAVRDIKAGITYINGATIGAEAHMPFGGVKETGNGHREGGWTVYDFFTEWKTVYVDYSGKLQRAQIDNY
ncbi:MAG: aldehyde dehydrogenase family protein, partial [Ignavibacteria bacterium]